MVAKLERVVKNWDYVAQPIQVSFSSQGRSHGLSHEVAREIRELAVELYNEHRLLEVSKRLTEIQQEVFAEIAKITEQLDTDAARLDEIAEERTELLEQMKAQAESWAGEITYEADVGVMKSKLRISPAGVHWKGTTIGLEEITRVRWSGTKHSVSGIPDRNEIPHHCRLRENLRPDRAEEAGDLQRIRRQALENSRCAAPHEMLEGLRAGRQYQFGTAVVSDDGMTLKRRRNVRSR